MPQTCSERVLFALPYPEPTDALNLIREKFPGIQITYVRTGTADEGYRGKQELDKNILNDKTTLVTLSALPTAVTDAPNLDLVHFCCSGTNHVANHPLYTDSSIPMTTSRGIHGPPIAEWVIMTALVHSHRYNLLHDLQSRQEWGKHGQFAGINDMVGQRVGILGYGAVGRQVGRVAKAMGMDVLAFTAKPRITPAERCDTDYCVPGTGDPDGAIPSRWFSGLGRSSLHHFLRQDLDIIVLCLPLTNKTNRLIGKEEFEILARRKTFVSNISRGGVIDQEALLDALDTGKIRGAALDVTYPEPLPLDHPLWRAPNVIISPHLSGLTQDYVERALGILELNLERRTRGQALLNVVERDRGY